MVAPGPEAPPPLTVEIFGLVGNIFILRFN